MMQKNFLVGGMLGDAIHTMTVVKHLTSTDGPGSNVLIGEGGDTWRYGAKQAHSEMWPLMKNQDYINGFFHLKEETDAPMINLNIWREVVAKTHAETGRYNICWSELLSQVYGYEIKHSKWIDAFKSDPVTEGRIVIHRSKHRRNGHFNWPTFMTEECIFVTNDINEWELFPHKDKARLHMINTISEMAYAIAGCKLFIGNQSAPLAMASALDVHRICELDADPAPFYMGEEKYSNNIKWFLNDQVNNL